MHTKDREIALLQQQLGEKVSHKFNPLASEFPDREYR